LYNFVGIISIQSIPKEYLLVTMTAIFVTAIAG